MTARSLRRPWDLEISVCASAPQVGHAEERMAR